LTITRDTSLEDLAAMICTAMVRRGLQAVLVGGSVVSIWSDNAYQSHDLDFITSAEAIQIDEVMASLGFRKTPSRHYDHPESDWLVEFPSPPLAIGEERITQWAQKETPVGMIHLLAPTECVMDRLAWYIHFKDRQALAQAVLVARSQPIHWPRVEEWARREGGAKEFEDLRGKLSRTSSRNRVTEED